MVKKTQKETKKADQVKFKGKYIGTIGRRKTAVAQVRLYKSGKGVMIVNNKPIQEYFSEDKIVTVNQPLKQAGLEKDLDFSILVKGSGLRAQSEAIRHGIARALILLDENLKPAIKAKGWLTRDARKKERKKPGLKKARRAPQWSKR